MGWLVGWFNDDGGHARGMSRLAMRFKRVVLRRSVSAGFRGVVVIWCVAVVWNRDGVHGRV